MTQRSTSSLKSTNDANFANNTTSNITPAVLRDFFTDHLDSFANNDELRQDTLSATALVVVLTDQATITWDAATALIANVEIAGNRTLDFPTNLVNGNIIEILIEQDGTGSRLITWDSAYNFESGSPTLSTAAGAVDRFIFRIWDQGGTLVGIEGNGPATAPVT